MSQPYPLLLELARRPSHNQAQFGELLRAAELLNAARVRVWLLRGHGGEFYPAVDHPEAGAPSPGVINPADHPDYFDTLESTLVLAGDDAQRDLRLRELTGGGLIAVEIQATLHLPMRVGGSLVGVLWIDSRQPGRVWTESEQCAAAAIAQIVSSAFDHVHRRRAEEILAYEKEHAQVTLDSIADGVITTDVHGRVDYINPFAIRLTGWPLNEARGKPLAEVLTMLSSSDRVRLDDVFDRCQSGAMSPLYPTEMLVVPRASQVAFDIDVKTDSASAPSTCPGNRCAMKISSTLCWASLPSTASSRVACVSRLPRPRRSPICSAPRNSSRSCRAWAAASRSPISAAA